jgi:signal transduction histidine kinase/ligand-binding sensor domain-containing protein
MNRIRMKEYAAVNFFRPALIVTMLFLLGSVILDASAQVLVHHSYTTPDGLPSNQVNVIYQDLHGYLWIGTNLGLSVYDGTAFSNYTTVQGLPNNWITAIIESRTSPGTMWIGTVAGGVCRFQRGSFRTYSLGTTPNLNNIAQILEDDRGNIWCLSLSGLFRIEKDSVKLVEVVESDNSTITRNASGEIWYQRGNMIAIYAQDGSRRATFHLPLRRGCSITQVIPCQDSSMLAAFSDSTLRQYRDSIEIARKKLPDGAFSQYSFDHEGLLWVRSHNEIVSFAPGRFADAPLSIYGVEDLRLSGWTGPVFCDREDNLWIGTWMGGLLKVSDRSLARIPITLAGSAFPDAEGHFWTGTEKGITEIYDDARGTWKRHEHKLDGDPQNMAPVFLDPQGRLWIRRDDLSCIDGYSIMRSAGLPSRLTRIARITASKDYPGGELTHFSVDRTNKIWICARGAVSVFNGHSLSRERVMTTAEGMPSMDVRLVFRDSDNNIWFGGYDGGLVVFRTRGGTLDSSRKFTVANGLPDDRIRSVYEDKEGRLWIGTRHGGVALEHYGGFRVVSMRDGLLSNSIWDIFEDAHDVLWLRTDAGLECIQKSTLAVLPRKEAFIGSRLFSAGLLPNGEIYLVRADGITLYDQRKEVRPTVPPLIHISAFSVNGTDREPRDYGEYPFDQNTVMIRYAGIALTNEKELNYRYRLIGIDTAWSSPTRERSVTYAALRPGDYSFEVIAVTSNGIAAPTPASISFSIAPPFWVRWWFLMMCFLVVGASIYALFRYRVNKLLEVERLRLQIASDLHDDIGSGLTRIAILSDVALQQERSGEAQAHADAPYSLGSFIETVGELSRELHESMGDVVWAIDPTHDSVEGLVQRVKLFAVQMCEAKNIALSIADTIGARHLSTESRRCLLLIAKEAITNIVRHSQATHAEISFETLKTNIRLTVRDDGKGFDLDTLPRVNGIMNCRRRAEKAGGTLSISSSPGNGTVVEAVIPTPG